MLPHFQQPGQAYFVTWSLIDALPPKALEVYTRQLRQITSSIEFTRKNNNDDVTLTKFKMEYASMRRKYMKAYDDLLHLQTKFIVDLSKTQNTNIVLESLRFWEGKRLENYAICVMNNHVHWVFRLFEKNELDEPVYLQDILHSVKRYSSNKINKLEGLKGPLWQKESYDTTIRDDKHLFRAIEYTINNPVEAGLVKDWKDWKGTFLASAAGSGFRGL
jgi:putative transposase